MLLIARLAIAGYDFEDIRDLECLFDTCCTDGSSALDKEITWKGLPEHQGDYWDKLREKVSKFDLEKLKADAADPTFTVKDLRRELRDMMRIIRIEK